MDPSILTIPVLGRQGARHPARFRLPPTRLGVRACVVLGQLVVAALVPLLPEEAYHWNFARHLDWGYYDHPPMIAWAIALGRFLLGDTPLGIRLVPLLFALGTAWLLGRLARRLYGATAEGWAVLLYAGQPAIVLVGSWGFPDSPLLFFWTLTLTLVWQALDSQRWGWWLAAGVALGGAMLSKYTASLLVPSVLLYLLRSRRDRHWLVTPWPYLAGICSLIVFTPVLYWNWTHQWASFQFQSVDRFQEPSRFQLGAGLMCLGEQWLAALPLTLPLAVVAVWRGARSAQPAEQLLFWSFAPTAVFFSGLYTLRLISHFHPLWPLPAYLSLTVLMAGVLAQGADRVAEFYRTRWRWLAGLGIAGMAVALVHAVWVLPGVPVLRETYGWREVADQARALQATLPEGSFLLATGERNYPSASQLAFTLRAPSEVYGQNLVGQDALQYRYWANPDLLRGKDAVVIITGGDPSGDTGRGLLRYFLAIGPARDLSIPVGTFSAWPRKSLHFTLYPAYGYHPEPAWPPGCRVE